jgi:hypothetical protein
VVDCNTGSFCDTTSKRIQCRAELKCDSFAVIVQSRLIGCCGSLALVRFLE